MEQVHRTAIRKSWTTIINSLTSDQIISVSDYLTEQNILTMAMREEIECEPRTSSKTRSLLNIIQKRGPRAFEALVDSLLRSGANHVTSVLLSNAGESVPETRNGRFTDTEHTDHVICNICMENTITVAFDPCGHTMCSECGERCMRQTKCCYCRHDVIRMIRIFIG